MDQTMFLQPYKRCPITDKLPIHLKIFVTCALKMFKYYNYNHNRDEPYV